MDKTIEVTDDTRSIIEDRFKQELPEHRLLAVQLNGFSHTLFYDDGTADKQPQVLRYSACAPEIKDDTFNQDVALHIFKQIPHWKYQGNPIEIIYVHPQER